MSSILKALEKADESQRSTRSAGMGRLPRGRERRPAWLIPAWALGGAAVAALATYAAMGGFSRPAGEVAKGHPAAAIPAPVQTARPVVVAPAVPVADKAVAVKKEPAVPAPAAARGTSAPTASAGPVTHPVAKAEPALRSVAKTAVRPAVERAGNVVARPQAVAEPPVKVHAATAVAPQPSAVAADPAAPAARELHPAPRVTGIAWQNSSEASFAMVNGRPLRQGGVIDGYRIEQIYEDGVRFSGKGGSFVVPLGAGQN